jgi:2-polyprenyl-3-methyl-5-hydroxy-6-metoxy-1,4-benzoquinol methylase
MGHDSRIGCGQNILSSWRAFQGKRVLLHDMYADVQIFEPKLSMLHEHISQH